MDSRISTLKFLNPFCRGRTSFWRLRRRKDHGRPRGLDRKTIEALGVAMIGSEGRAYLTPVLTDLKHATNIGLTSAVTKQLLETLRDRRASSAGYLVRQSDRALERALEQSGCGKSDLQVATEYAEYLEYSGTPQRILEALGLNSTRLGDLLALALDGPELDRLSTYQFALAAGLAPYLSDQIRYAPLLLGLIDVIAALPPELRHPHHRLQQATAVLSSAGMVPVPPRFSDRKIAAQLFRRCPRPVGARIMPDSFVSSMGSAFTETG